MTSEPEDFDALSFSAVEKGIYIDPPCVPENTPDNIKLSLWRSWQKKEAAARKAHKTAFTKSLQATIPDFAYQSTTYKSGGVHRQHIGSTAIQGEEGNIEHMISVPATQDKHFQARGVRAGKGTKKDKRRKNKRLKTQQILNRRTAK